MAETQMDRFELPGGFALVYRRPIEGWVLEGPTGTTFLTYNDEMAHAFAAALGKPGGSDEPSPAGANRYRHRQRGTTYVVIGTATVQAATRPVGEGDAVVVYRSDDDGQLWVRRREEFHDGRFERLDDEFGKV